MINFYGDVMPPDSFQYWTGR